jgi:hypothetical protein
VAKQPTDPAQRAQQTIAAEREARAVAAALEGLRRQLDPTRTALQATTKAAGMFGGVVNGMQTLASFGGRPAAAIGAIGGQFGKLLGMAGPWGAAAGAFVSTLSQLPQLFKSAGDSMAELVAKFSPATASRWTAAWDDLSAALGGYLAPVLEQMTGVVRFFGDTIAAWGPVFEPLIAQMSQMAGLFGSAIGDTLNAYGEFAIVTAQVMQPFLQVMIEIGAGPMRLVVDLMGQFADWLREVAQRLALFFGIEVPKVAGSSSGMAAKSTGVSTVQNMLTQLQQRAFALGGGFGKKEDYAMKSVDILGKIFAWLQNELPKHLIQLGVDAYNWFVTEMNRTVGPLVTQGVNIATRVLAIYNIANTAAIKFGLSAVGKSFNPYSS